jgi:hypothetical protein
MLPGDRKMRNEKSGVFEIKALPENLSPQKNAKITKNKAFQRVSCCLAAISLLQML